MTFNRIMFLDSETTGFDPKVDRCIEVAACLYDVGLAAPVSTFASLLKSDTNAAESINNISPALLVDATPAEKVWPFVERMASRADVIVAHNADFDRGFVTETLRVLKPWACSCNDMPWPVGKPRSSAVNLALAHGLAVFSAHRALTDVDLLVRIFQAATKAGTDIQRLLTLAVRPKTLVIACVPYDKKDEAKAAGFVWNEIIAKEWCRWMPLEDVDALPFKVRWDT